MPFLPWRPHRASRPPVLRPLAGDRGFAVVDLETTGLFPERHDRIVEIGIVLLGPGLDAQAEWTTLVNPCRDVGPTRIHGITATQVAGAPLFADIVGDVCGRISNRVLVGHNVTFDLRFLRAELAPFGARLDDAAGLCTMALAARSGIVGRTLGACCAEVGIDAGAHHALADAEAAASLFRWCVQNDGSDVPTLPAPIPGSALPSLPASGRSLTRDAARPAARTTLASLAARLPVAHIGVPDGDGIDTYVGLLDRTLEDRRLSAEELEGLAETAVSLGLDASAVAQVHQGYFAGLARLALADGVLTEAERADLVCIAELLGTPDAVNDLRSMAGQPGLVVDRVNEYRGKRVCFTGASVCTLDGVPLDRRTQQRLASAAGLVVEEQVTKGLDLLVLADPASTSGKARKADQYGVRKVAERAFWASIDAPID